MIIEAHQSSFRLFVSPARKHKSRLCWAERTVYICVLHTVCIPVGIYMYMFTLYSVRSVCTQRIESVRSKSLSAYECLLQFKINVFENHCGFNPIC